jgi:hypothetical protein
MKTIYASARRVSTPSNAHSNDITDRKIGSKVTPMQSQKSSQRLLTRPSRMAHSVIYRVIGIVGIVVFLAVAAASKIGRSS